MAKFKAVLHTAKQLPASTKVKIQVTHKGETRYVCTGIAINPSTQFKQGEVVNHPLGREYNIKIRGIINAFDEKILTIGPLRLKNMSMETLLHILRSIEGGSTTDGDFFSYAQKHTEQLRQAHRTSTADLMAQTCKLLRAEMGLQYLSFHDITPYFLNQLKRRLSIKGYSPTTAGIHFRNIRALYNMAITDPSQPISYNDYPFREFKIPKSATRKISMSIENLQKLTNYSPKSGTEAQAVDLFLLSFYLIGINFKDLLLLKISDLQGERLVFDRAKTGKPYSILMLPEARVICKRLAGKKYLLNLMERKIEAKKKATRTTPLYKDITDQTNRTLKKIAAAEGLPPTLSTYWARHTWATIARNIGIPKDDIVTALGHGDNRVTDAYIEIDLTRIDKANRAVIDAVKAYKLLAE